MVEQNSRTIAQVMGEIAWLLTQAAHYKHLTLADLEWAVMPAILLNQFHIFYKERQPIAAVIWATLSPENEKTFTAQPEARKFAQLPTKAWRTGDRLWIIEMISPFAITENKLDTELIAQMTKVFNGRPFYFLKRNAHTHTLEVAQNVKEMVNG
jgi:cytolysin-activating lysine-acyltransferase